MLLLPLGFGSRLPSFPYMTLAITLVVCVISIPYFKNLGEIDRVRTEAAEAAQVNEKLASFALSACRLSEPECKEVAELLPLSTDKAKMIESLTTYIKSNKLEGSTRDKQLENIVDYIKTLRQNPELFSSELKSAEGFTELKQAYDDSIEAALPVFKTHYFLTAKTKGFVQLLTAQFTHANWMHLLVNLFVFIVFGAVLEARMGAAAFAGLYLLGGTIGLLVELPLQHGALVPLLGASANIAAVTGAFFVFYFRRPMKILATLVVYNKILEVPTWLMVGAFFLLSDIGGAASTGDGVAHVAHLTGFAIGALCALAMKMNDGLNEQYLFPIEYDWHKAMLEQPTIRGKIESANLILKYNPDNQLVLGQVFGFIQKTDATLDTRQFFVKNFSRSLAISLKNRDRKAIDKRLDEFPDDTSLIDSLAGLSAKHLLVLSEHELKTGHWLIAMRISDAFRFHYPTQKASAKFEATMTNVIDHLRKSGADLEALYTYRNLEPKTTYQKLIADFENSTPKEKPYGRAG